MAKKPDLGNEYNSFKRFVDIDIGANHLRCGIDFSRQIGKTLQDFLDGMQKGKYQTKGEAIHEGMSAFEELEKELSKSTGKPVLFRIKFYAKMIYDHWKNKTFRDNLDNLVKELLLTKEAPEEEEHDPLKELQKYVGTDIKNNLTEYGIDFSKEFGMLLQSYLRAIKKYKPKTKKEANRAGNKARRKLKHILKDTAKKSVKFENTNKCWSIIYDQSKKQNGQFLDGLDNYIRTLLAEETKEKKSLEKLQSYIRRDIEVNLKRCGADFSAVIGAMLQSYLRALKKYNPQTEEEAIGAANKVFEELEKKLTRYTRKFVIFNCIRSRTCRKMIYHYWKNQDLNDLNAIIKKLSQTKS